MNKEHEKYMAEAIALSEQSIASGGGPFGTVIVKDGKIIGRGMNRVTTWNDPTAHGEIVAIREACKNLNSFQLESCIIYTNCEPCPMCLGAIYWARPKAIYFANTKEEAASIGFDDAFIYEEINVLYVDRRIPFFQIMQEEAKRAFQSWVEQDNKTEY